MKYKNNPSACLSRAEWSRVLQPSAGDDLDPQQQLDQEHLTQCSACRDTLELLAGGTLWSDEVQSWLDPVDDPGPQLESFIERVTASVCALAIGTDNGVAHDPLCEHEIKQLQQLLSPASHPELLGRLGRYELQQLADALAAAHAQGLVHRDVKPGNVLLEAVGSRALLSDFGLVRTLDAATLTRSGILTGTPDYMSPEQARGEAVTQASDLFSLGAVLYHVLSGHPPFRASDPMAVLNRICHTRHRSLLGSHPEVPREVSRMVDKLLSKDPKRRFGSAVELRDHLQELLSTTLRLSGRASWLLPVVGAAGVVAVLLAAGLWWSQSRPVPDANSFSDPNHASDSTAEATGKIAETSSTDAAQSRGGHFETSSFPQLMELDPLLEQLAQRTQSLSDEFVISYDNSADAAPLRAVEFDRRVDDLNERLQRLEQDLK